MSGAESSSEPQETRYLMLVWSSALLFVVCAAALLILMLATVIGPFHFFGLSQQQVARAVGLWHLGPASGVASLATRRRYDAWISNLPRDLPLLHSPSLDDLQRSGVPVIVTASAICHVAALLLLMPTYGAQGAAAATVISSLVSGIWLLAITHRVTGIAPTVIARRG